MKFTAHPAATHALAYLKGLDEKTLTKCRGFFEGMASQGSRTAAACLMTMDALKSDKRPGDTDILGLAWVVKTLLEDLGFSR